LQHVTLLGSLSFFFSFFFFAITKTLPHLFPFSDTSLTTLSKFQYKYKYAAFQN